MNDKNKIGFPMHQSFTLRTSFQPSSPNNLHSQLSTQQPYVNSHSNMTSVDSSLQQQQKPVDVGKHKNYSVTMKHLENKMEKIQTAFTHLKKQQHVIPKETASNNELRASLSTSSIKKNDLQFLRRTAHSPKAFTFLSEKHFAEQPTEVEAPFSQTKPQPIMNSQSSTNLFVRKTGSTNETVQQVIEVPNKPKFITKGSILKKDMTSSTNLTSNIVNNSSNLSNSAHFKYQRKSLTKSSQIVCGFYLGKSLGNGKFGQVYLAKHVASGIVCALKKIVKAKVKKENMIDQLVQQIKLQNFLNHANLVQFYGVVSDEQNIYIIMEYMEGGTLFEYLGNKNTLPEHQAATFLREVCQAIKFMHDKNISHRDIKPENIVLNYGLAKLCDFGWATRISGTRNTYCGTFGYLPPEMLEKKEYDAAVDVWCLGILTYELLTGTLPFDHQQRKMAMQKILNVDKEKITYPESVSPLARDFIESLIKKNPNERLKAYKLLDHPFLKKKEDDKF